MSQRPLSAPVGRPEAGGGGTPDAFGRGAQDLVPPGQREAQLVQRAAEPFQQERAPVLVRPQQPDAAVAAG